jgi:uncharacterized Zn finger protein
VTAEGDVVVVRSDDHVQRVRLGGTTASCTCPWWARYAGGRRPCKHVLAAQILVRGDATDPAAPPVGRAPERAP